MARPKEFDRNAALQRAIRLFWTKGYEGTSMSDLTETMGISRSSLYETFGGKEALFLEAIRHYQETNDRRKAVIVARAATVREAFAAFFRSMTDFALSDELPGGCFFTNTATALGTMDEPVRALIEAGLERQEAFFYGLVERGIQSGEMGPDLDARALARFFVALVRGMTVIARVTKDRAMLEEIAAVGLRALD